MKHNLLHPPCPSFENFAGLLIEEDLLPMKIRSLMPREYTFNVWMYKLHEFMFVHRVTKILTERLAPLQHKVHDQIYFLFFLTIMNGVCAIRGFTPTNTIPPWKGHIRASSLYHKIWSSISGAVRFEMGLSSPCTGSRQVCNLHLQIRPSKWP